MSPVKGTLSPRVLHIRRSDETDSHVLLHVSRSDSTGELTIIATEGEFPYTATCKRPLKLLSLFRATNVHVQCSSLS